jgi:hypothetical protein
MFPLVRSECNRPGLACERPSKRPLSEPAGGDGQMTIIPLLVGEDCWLVLLYPRSHGIVHTVVQDNLAFYIQDVVCHLSF